MTERRETSPAPKLEKAEVLTYVAKLYHGPALSPEGMEELLGERSLEQVARKASRSIIGLRTLKVIKGSFKIEEKSVTFTSKAFDEEGGTAYIDGKVFTLEEVANNPALNKIHAWMIRDNYTKVIRTRVGGFLGFSERDSVISLEEVSTAPEA